MTKEPSSSLIIGAALTLGLACGDARDPFPPDYYGPSSAGEMMAGTPLQPATPSPASSQLESTPASAGSSSPSASTSSDGAPASAPLQGDPASAVNAGAAGKCDLSGRWLSTVHKVTDALGQLQYVHTYDYYEIEQQGPAFIVSKGLRCGDDGRGTGLFAATVDFSATWEAVRQRVSYAGRRGTSVEVAGGCEVALEPWYMVLGATLPHYLDPSIPLPSADEAATGASPGWEDWDEDGNPGITGQVSGAVSGEVYVAPRSWTSASGIVADVGTTFSLPLEWDQEPNVMAVDGSSLLSSSAARAADPELHFVDFARLEPGLATGDDAALCRELVELAPSLTPRAAGL